MKRATLSAKREVHICRSAKRDDHKIARPRRAHTCERSELRAKRAMRMCERSEQIFILILEADDNVKSDVIDLRNMRVPIFSLLRPHKFWQPPKICIYNISNDESTGGSGGSTPDFQAGGSGFDSWAGTNGNFLSTSTEALVVRNPL